MGRLAALLGAVIVLAATAVAFSMGGGGRGDQAPVSRAQVVAARARLAEAMTIAQANETPVNGFPRDLTVALQRSDPGVRFVAGNITPQEGEVSVARIMSGGGVVLATRVGKQCLYEAHFGQMPVDLTVGPEASAMASVWHAGTWVATRNGGRCQADAWQGVPWQSVGR